MTISATFAFRRRGAEKMGLDFHLLAVPEKDGQVLALPPLGAYPGVIAHNRGLNAGARIAGADLTEFRSAARENALKIARAYTISLGLDPGPAPVSPAPIIATGHQPQCFHPGVMIKISAMTRSARALGAGALFISVDSDEFRAENAVTPVLRNGRLERMEYPLFPARRGGLYETMEAEPPSDLLSRMEAMAGFMGESRLAAPRLALDEFREKLARVRLDFKDYVSTACVMRRIWLAPETDGFLELPVSLMSAGEPFLRFAAHIVALIGPFAQAYNGALDEYRIARKLRYPANPFPNLETAGGLIQAPFWALGAGGREKLFVRHHSGEGIALRTESGEDMPASAITEGKLKIRPKAITLSLYMRLALCDLFIHGVGGAKYDHVTDRIIASFFNAHPPDYACVSATLWPRVSAEDPRPRMEEIERKLREIGQHPEIAGALEPSIAPLAEEKRLLVGRIKEPGADKKSIGVRISELNRMMAGLLEAQRRLLEREIGEMLPLEKERQAAQNREYPYFLHSKKAFEEICSQLPG